MRKLIRERIIPLGSIGAKIRKIREIRGLTQKELGLRCGFSEATAGVRIRQYESNQKTPREQAIKVLAEALEIDDTALFDADLSDPDRALHALFDIEDCLGLHPVMVRGKYYLEFSGTTRNTRSDVDPYSYYEFLKEWSEMRAESLSEKKPDSLELTEKEKAYDLWRYSYVRNESQKNSIRR